MAVVLYQAPIKEAEQHQATIQAEEANLEPVLVAANCYLLVKVPKEVVGLILIKEVKYFHPIGQVEVNLEPILVVAKCPDLAVLAEVVNLELMLAAAKSLRSKDLKEAVGLRLVKEAAICLRLV